MGSADTIDVHLGIGNATGATFTSSLPSGWTVLSNPFDGQLLISGYSLTPMNAGDYKIGSVSFETGVASQMLLGVDSGTSVGGINATPYGYMLAHDTTSAKGSYTMSPIDPGTYAVTASLMVSIFTVLLSLDHGSWIIDHGSWVVDHDFFWRHVDR